MNLTQVKAQDASVATPKSVVKDSVTEVEQVHQDAMDTANRSIFLQPRLAIGPVHDPMEQEADAVADRVVRMPMSGAVFSGVNQQSPVTVQRKCEKCEQEEEGKVQRKSNASHGTGAGFASSALSQQIQSTRGAGQTLDGHTRQFMETGFGRDFGQVRIHTGAYAAQMNHDLNAHAFTVGSDIYFNAGRFAPESASGRHLLAHELTHTIQQSQGIHRKPMIQRACDTVAYDARMVDIRALPLFQNIPAHPDPLRNPLTPAEALAKAEAIMTEARLRDNCMYYADALHTLFSTVEAPPSSSARNFGPDMATAATNEATRLGRAFGTAHQFDEEDASAAATMVDETSRGKTFKIDRRDPANVVIKVKVFPSAGDPTAIANLIATQDAIEKKASVLGYTIDLDFVTASGPDVYEVRADPGAWPDAGNWVGAPEVTAHELHHKLGLPDLYNYIDDHSGNDQMFIVDRIRWFDVEFRRAPSPLLDVSFMGNGNLVTDEDICGAMHAPDIPACLTARRALRQPGFTARDATRTRVLRIIEILRNINTTAAEVSIVSTHGTTAMGANFVVPTVITQLTALAAELSTAEIQMENASGIECETQTLAFMTSPHAFIICPTFTPLTGAQKAHQFVRAGAELGAVPTTNADQLGQFIELVFDSTAAPVQPVQPVQPVAPPAARVWPTTLTVGGGAGTDSLALFELQQRIWSFGERTPGGISVPVSLQLTLGAYGFTDRGSAGGALGLSSDFRLATLPPTAPGAFGINVGGGFTAGGTGIGSTTGVQPELGGYGRAGIFLDTSNFRISPQYQFNYLRNIGAGTDAQIHTFLMQLGYAF